MEARSTYYCVDIECNGPVPGFYDMVSLGAVVVAPGKNGRLAIHEKFYAELKPVAPRFDPRAAAIHGLDQEVLKAKGMDRLEFCEDLAAWVSETRRPGTDATFVGHMAPFDWSFVAWTFEAAGVPNPFGYKAMCTKSMATGALHLHWLDAHKSTLEELLDIPPEDPSLKHRADYDAEFQAKILIGLLE
jgi:DNA polymerase III epsilon subunit-like protein